MVYHLMGTLNTGVGGFLLNVRKYTQDSSDIVTVELLIRTCMFSVKL